MQNVTRALDVSILISTYNRKDILLATLGRLTRLQSHLDCTVEIIVVDNASPDGSGDAVATRFPNVRLIRNLSNQGACAKNFGLAIARGELTLFLDDDSYPDAQSVRQLCWHFAVDNSLGAAVFNVHLPDGSCECSAYPSVVIGCGTGFRTAALLEVGGLPDDFFMQAEEYDLSLKLLNAGWTIRRFNDLHVKHEKTPSARMPLRTTRLDARNNLLLIARRFPARRVLPFAIDWMRRYAWLSATRGRGHRRAFITGVLQGLLRVAVTTHLRKPVSDSAFEHFARLRETELRLKAWAAKFDHRRVVMIDLGKNVMAVHQAARAAGLTVVAIADETLGGRGHRYHGIEVVSDADACRMSYDAALIATSSPVHAARRARHWAQLQPKPVVDLFAVAHTRGRRAA